MPIAKRSHDIHRIVSLNTRPCLILIKRWHKKTEPNNETALLAQRLRG